MNLIEQLGYEYAKEIYLSNLEDFSGNASGATISKEKLRFTHEELEKALLEYRRANNIFEVGDKIVYYTLPHERLFYVKAVLNGSIVVHECLDELSARCFSEFNPYDEIRHATDVEIKAGKRLEVV
ncbi:hypothetical protein [Acinetobacter radioresistens]|uniref:hypothetical protein n=1 Tax=Acinetobacter radioresistens TaxID=40216 RepID=UPI00125EFC3C|nr:hypothetical protein [Acinetobacter radioresistens]